MTGRAPNLIDMQDASGPGEIQALSFYKGKILFMTTYVALLRGIGPTNPNMHPKKLKGAFEKMGFKNVRTVISSGNVVFESASKSESLLETKIEKALPKLLGFKSTTIIRSKDSIEKLVRKNPFKGIEDNMPNYLVVTYFKDHTKELCTVIDMTAGKTPDFMRQLEKKHGKAVTTRTWKTVHRILAKMQA
ncbi:MAG: DUF1697 domain-containing protein [Patescibacteria group bacterium]